jgi:hypothetical protein
MKKMPADAPSAQSPCSCAMQLSQTIGPFDFVNGPEVAGPAFTSMVDFSSEFCN